MKKICAILVLFLATINSSGQSLCSGAPANNTILIAANCAGTYTLSLQNPYGSSGITYQWNSGVSVVGPFNAVVNGTNSSVVVTPTAVTWYNVVVTCASSGSFTVMAAVQPSVQGVVLNSPPYYEGFQGINANNTLPNCSWLATGLGTTALTYTGSNSAAAFYYNPPAITHFYSNGIQLNAGVTYSASVWWTSNNTNYTTWSDLSLLVGPSQSPTGLVSIVSTNGPALNQVYSALSKTFAVSSSGTYYIAVRGTSNGSGLATHLYWDDLSITMPCNVAPNSPVLSITPGTIAVCANSTIAPVITASGADTYSWSNGSNTATTTASGFTSGSITVTGTKTVTGCSSSKSALVIVNPSPNVTAFANKSSICVGESATLTPFGANSYSWTGSTSTVVPIVVTPTITTTYTITGSNTSGCESSAVLTIIVNQLPILSAGGTQSACPGDQVQLHVTGALSYTWSGAMLTFQGPNINFVLAGSSNFTINGMDVNGCISSIPFNVTALTCTGINESQLTPVLMYPNPTTGAIIIRSDNNAEISVSDGQGQIVLKCGIEAGNHIIDLRRLTPGVYIVKMVSEKGAQIFRIIRQ